MWWTDDKVRVTLIDEETGAPFATTKMRPDDLPESFELETVLHLGDADWSVVHAEPTTRPEYSKSRTLTLRLRRVKTVDLSNILFSLPSICNRLGALGDGVLSGDECVLIEDDWRQFELVSRSFSRDADAEIEAIRRIHEEEKADVGWRNLHVRRRLDQPIAVPLTLKDVDQAFGGGIAFRGVTYRGARTPIASGYSFIAADGLQCYGVAEDGHVTVLGIVQNRPSTPAARSADALTQLARRFDLDLVHWCRCVRASCDNPLFRHLLIGTDA
jgi:hypothetical protein